MNWRPGADVATAQRRAALLRRVRHYFYEQEVLEVQTPALGEYAVTDVHIDSISAQAPLLGKQYFLRTSPEYPLKRLLAAGYPDVFEIGPVFRDGECGKRHQPEFTMLEWYRHGFSIGDIVADTLSLLSSALSESGLAHCAPRIATYDDLLLEQLGVESDASLQTLRTHLPVDFPESLVRDRDAILNWLFDQHVAASFSSDAFTAVTHYPASQAALACVDAVSNRALRFEIYRGPLELANGFVELRDSLEQRHRFELDNNKRREQDRPAMALDAPFLEALEAGLPHCAGVAVGIDRLMMVLTQTDNISSVVSFTSH